MNESASLIHTRPRNDTEGWTQRGPATRTSASRRARAHAAERPVPLTVFHPVPRAFTVRQVLWPRLAPLLGSWSGRPSKPPLPPGCPALGPLLLHVDSALSFVGTALTPPPPPSFSCAGFPRRRPVRCCRGDVYSEVVCSPARVLAVGALHREATFDLEWLVVVGVAAASEESSDQANLAPGRRPLLWGAPPVVCAGCVPACFAPGFDSARDKSVLGERARRVRHSSGSSGRELRSSRPISWLSFPSFFFWNSGPQCFRLVRA